MTAVLVPSAVHSDPPEEEVPMARLLGRTLGSERVSPWQVSGESEVEYRADFTLHCLHLHAVRQSPGGGDICEATETQAGF